MGTLRGATPKPSAIDAAVSLLVDTDPRVAAACRRQLLRWGRAAVPSLRAAAEAGDPTLRANARALLRTMELRLWTARMRRLAKPVRRGAATPPRQHRALEAAAISVSSLARGDGVDRAAVTALLDLHGEALREALRGRTRTAAGAARAMRDCLGIELAFSGGREGRYDLRGIALDEVLQRRTGTPAALALLYVLVGRRAGLGVTGVAVVDRTLVRLHGARSVLVDPYLGGRTVTKSQCISDLRASAYAAASAATLEELDDSQLLQRVLDDLARVYGYREDAEVLRALVAAKRALVPDRAG